METDKNYVSDKDRKQMQDLMKQFQEATDAGQKVKPGTN